MHDQVVGSPWLLVGDYYIIADPSESLSRCSAAGHKADMEEFKACLQQLALFDHHYSWSFFTWFNNHQDDFLSRKLDSGCFPSFFS